MLGIQKSRTAPCWPSGNGQVERNYRTLMDAVHCYIDSQPKTWDKYLGPLMIRGIPVSHKQGIHRIHLCLEERLMYQQP